MTTRPYVNPEDLTEAERERRIIELLAIASIRMAREQNAERSIAPSNPEKMAGTACAESSP